MQGKKSGPKEEPTKKQQASKSTTQNRSSKKPQTSKKQLPDASVKSKTADKKNQDKQDNKNKKTSKPRQSPQKGNVEAKKSNNAKKTELQDKKHDIQKNKNKKNKKEQNEIRAYNKDMPMSIAEYYACLYGDEMERKKNKLHLGRWIFITIIFAIIIFAVMKGPNINIFFSEIQKFVKYFN